MLSVQECKNCAGTGWYPEKGEIISFKNYRCKKCKGTGNIIKKRK